MPNAFAYVVFYGWPLVAVALFVRLPLQRAMLWTIIAGYLVMPHRIAFNIPMLPPYEKGLAAAGAALIMCLVMQGTRGPDTATWRNAGWLPRSPLLKLLLLAFFLQPALTVMTNLQPTSSGGRTLPGLRPYDIGAAFYGAAAAILPFLLARRYLATPDGPATALRVLAIAGVAYSLLVAYEARVSPQLNRVIYGYTQFSWVQQLRDGGFRPVVFLQHGLWTAIFMAMAVTAAAALWRSAEGAARQIWMGSMLWMGAVLTLSNSFGALVLAAILAPLARLASPAAQRLAILAIALVALSYPMMRGVGLVPTQALVESARSLGNEGRALSLQFRFTNEDMLLERANLKPLFGWGGWGRGRIYDDDTGNSASVTDGRWIITFGTAGWLGYIAEFGLLTAPLILVALAGRRRPLSPIAAGLSLALCANLMDMLPNGTLTPLTWLLAGAVLACAESRAPETDPGKAPAPPPTQRKLQPIFGAVTSPPGLKS